MSNSHEPSRANPSYRKRLKQALFERDGYECFGVWFAECSFDCGITLDWESATIDRFPTPGCYGGKYEIGNTRLACMPCNSTDGGLSSAALNRALLRREKGFKLSKEQQELLANYVPNGSKSNSYKRKHKRKDSLVTINNKEHLTQHPIIKDYVNGDKP